MITTQYYGPQTEAQNRMVGDFVSSIVWGKADCLTDYCTMAVVDGKELIAGTVYHNWHPEEGVIELTSGSLSKRWLTKSVIYSMFRLPFEQLGCQMVVLRVSEKNKNMVGIARKFGFSQTLIPRLRGRDEAEYIFTFTDDQWKHSPYNKAPSDVAPRLPLPNV